MRLGPPHTSGNFLGGSPCGGLQTQAAPSGFKADRRHKAPKRCPNQPVPIPPQTTSQPAGLRVRPAAKFHTLFITPVTKAGGGIDRVELLTCSTDLCVRSAKSFTIFSLRDTARRCVSIRNRTSRTQTNEEISPLNFGLDRRMARRPIFGSTDSEDTRRAKKPPSLRRPTRGTANGSSLPLLGTETGVDVSPPRTQTSLRPPRLKRPRRPRRLALWCH